MRYPWSIPFLHLLFLHRKTDLLTSKTIAMKKFENTFAVTGFVGKDAKIRNFTNASVAHFSLAIGRQEKKWRGNQAQIRFHKRGSVAQE